MLGFSRVFLADRAFGSGVSSRWGSSLQSPGPSPIHVKQAQDCMTSADVIPKP